MIKTISTDLILTGSNVRKEQDNEIQELAASIADIGLQNAIVVTPTGSGKYKIVSGHRRFLACQYLGVDEVECNIIDIDYSEKLKYQMAENIHRKNMSAYEIVEIINTLRNEKGCSIKQIAKIFGKSIQWVTLQITAVNALNREYGDSGIIPEERKQESASTIMAKRKHKIDGARKVYDCKGFTVMGKRHSYMFNFSDVEKENEILAFIEKYKI